MDLLKLVDEPGVRVVRLQECPDVYIRPVLSKGYGHVRPRFELHLRKDDEHNVLFHEAFLNGIHFVVLTSLRTIALVDHLISG